MNATKAIRAAQRKAPGQAVSQLVSVGVELTLEVVLKLRDPGIRHLASTSPCS
ncbi:MAG: hypothetical protein NTY98_01475 [Verrucomicrobia bacterium]|nr:hypothetical protein [Verrucomicrobiota bacterium]